MHGVGTVEVLLYAVSMVATNSTSTDRCSTYVVEVIIHVQMCPNGSQAGHPFEDVACQKKCLSNFSNTSQGVH